VVSLRCNVNDLNAKTEASPCPLADPEGNPATAAVIFGSENFSDSVYCVTCMVSSRPTCSWLSSTTHSSHENSQPLFTIILVGTDETLPRVIEYNFAKSRKVIQGHSK